MIKCDILFSTEILYCKIFHLNVVIGHKGYIIINQYEHKCIMTDVEMEIERERERERERDIYRYIYIYIHI